MILPRIYVTQLSGRNARNNSWRVEIDPDLRHFHAVLAQEVWESNHKRGALIRPLRWFRMVFQREKFKQDMEIMGHEVEVQMAVILDGVDPATYRWKEANSMSTHYDQFRDWDSVRIEAAMRRRTSEARAWCRQWEKTLLKVEKT